MKIHILFIFGALIGLSSNSIAQHRNTTKPGEFAAKIVLGFEHDSNVAIEEIDQNARSGDSLFSTAMNLNYDKDLTDQSDFGLSYSYSNDAYDEFDQFDLTTQFLTANYTHKLDDYTVGGTARYIVSDLDSEKFLTLGQLSANVSRLLSKKRFLRVDYTYTDKSLENFRSRDSSKHALGADLYYFLDGAKRYWVFGYQFADEDATSDELDRTIHSLKARYTQKLSLFGREASSRFKARYQVRDYDAITPSIGLVRDDDRLRLGAELEFDLTDNWFAALEYEYSDYTSNLPSADYNQNLVTLRVGWQFKTDVR